MKHDLYPVGPQDNGYTIKGIVQEPRLGNHETIDNG